jgi:ABC-type branched-subunit amino acid transport system permease subunit
LGAYRDLIMGGLAVILVLTLPKGVMGLFRKLFLAPDESG